MSVVYDEHIIHIFEGRPQYYPIIKYSSSKSETKTNRKAWTIEVSLYISSCGETHWMDAISP